MFGRNKAVFLVALTFSVALLVQSVASTTPPVASFTYTPTAPIFGDVVAFDASTSTPDGGTIVSYTWNFGDGTPSQNTPNPTIEYNYTAFGTYNVTLTVTDSEMETDTTWQIVIVREYPIAVFTYTPAWPIVGETVTFNASLSTPEGGHITSYYWDFDDGTNGTGVVVDHTYTAVGNYNVTLTVTDNETLTDTTWDVVTVRDYPVATFTYSPAAPLVNQMVTFNASLSTPDNGTIVSYYWDFDDGSPPVTEADPITNHTYTTFGNFTVTLNITDSEDLTDDFSDTIRILIAPVANFTYSPPWPVVNETVTFNASASYDPDISTSIVSYRWDFGDGVTEIYVKDVNLTDIATHAYTAFGTYNITLTVTDDDGLTDITWKLVTVYTVIFVHDVAITNVTTSATEVYVGQIINITVVALNEGETTETFNVTVYYDATSIGTKTNITLHSNESIILTFSWHTTGVTPSTYTISAQASLLPGPPPETDTADNTLVDGTIKVKKFCDIDGDGVVGIGDVILVMLNWGPVPPKDPKYDVDGDGTVGIGDVIVVFLNWA